MDGEQHLKSELTHLRGEISCSYQWSTGETVGTFLESLRDRGVILGAVCGGCGKVCVPPHSYCEVCGVGTGDLTEVGPTGIVMSWARVTDHMQGAPVKAPFRFVLVRLAGADTSMLHLAPDDQRIKIGCKVVPEFRRKRTGSITDIKWFVPQS